MKPSILSKALLAAGLMVAVAPAMAGTSTANMAVSGTVVASCSIAAAALSFGTTIPATIASNIDPSPVNVTATCANTVPYDITFGAGAGSGASFATRKLTSGGNTLDYSLYRDSSRTEVLGDGTGSTFKISSTGTGSAQVHAIYGRIPTQTATGTGAYTDTVVVTVTF